MFNLGHIFASLTQNITCIYSDAKWNNCGVIGPPHTPSKQNKTSYITYIKGTTSKAAGNNKSKLKQIRVCHCYPEMSAWND